MQSFHVKFGLTDKRTMVKQHTPDLSIRGHKKRPLENIVRKGENAGNLVFYFSQILFSDRKIMKG